ncbi:MAG: hypothetical protein NUW06_05380 [Candidatus Acetothermia bacterium]|jgi:hypothetical protein|nr:hypothetical protein [Candidatus Acetothermia bacterium]MDH7505576.1 hypothetical protein [Candidatus Acetothermia bacterium]
MRKILLVLPLALILLGLGTISLGGADRAITLTIYGNDLALVTELVTLRLELEQTRVSLTGLPNRLITDSVSLEVLSGELQVLEQQFLYEPLSQATLLRKFLGREIEVREGVNIYRGTLLGLDGAVIIQERTGEVQIVKDPTGFTLPGLPELTSEPTLSWLVATDLVGPQPARLDYLTTGLSWEATYLGILNEEELDLKSRVSVSNSSGLSYRDVTLRLVAGQPHRVGTVRGLGYAKETAMAAAAPQFAEAAAFEYHLYTLDRPATIEDGTTKELSFISAPHVQIARHYIYEGQYRDGVWTEVEFSNSKANGLGQPLPAGTIRFYQDGLFVGEGTIPHTPVDEEVTLTVGRAFDLIGERTLVDQRRIAERKYRDTVLVTLKNHKEQDVTVKVIEHPQGDWTILQASPEYKKVDAETIEFELPVQAGGEAQVSYTVEYQY